jgi:hypothetical protein
MVKWLMLVYGEGEPSDFPIGSKKYIKCAIPGVLEEVNKEFFDLVLDRIKEQLLRAVKEDK